MGGINATRQSLPLGSKDYTVIGLQQTNVFLNIIMIIKKNVSYTSWEDMRHIRAKGSSLSIMPGPVCETEPQRRISAKVVVFK